MQKSLTAKEKQLLLEIAREAIISHVRNGTVPKREVKNSNLLAKQGCFVCIKVSGMLRGCIGNFLSDQPLHELVQEMAVSAATRDPRFYPMKEDDLQDFDLEISVLSPLHRISVIDEIEVGVHGLYMEKNFSRGVLLPQVAVEYGWDRDTFLSQTSIKAGLGKDDWKEDTDIYTFSALVFQD
ncbi:MAG TPA: AmmeMemoRadiSam system protein A [Geobacteraceae bacterium]|nr:AmmeMemoRadiSam system protein A [Geobacteraceae bacterium]